MKHHKNLFAALLTTIVTGKADAATLDFDQTNTLLDEIVAFMSVELAIGISTVALIIVGFLFYFGGQAWMRLTYVLIGIVVIISSGAIVAGLFGS